MSRGQLVPDETIVRVFLDRLEAPDAVDGAILDGFPRTKVQAEALDAALEEAGRRVDRAAYIDVPLEDLVKRMANRRICTANGHVYNLVSNPPRDLVCDLDGSALVQRADDAEATVRARMAQQVPPLLEVVEHYRDHGILTTVDGRLGIDAVTETLMDALARRRSRLTWSPASRAARSNGCAGPGASSARSSTSSRPSSARASRPPTSTPSPRPTSGSPARPRRSRAIRGSTRAGRSRPASASRSTTRSSTASPASGRSAPARSCRSTPARSSTAGTATARGPSTSASRRPGSPSSST